LIELIIVVAIIGILAVIAAPMVRDAPLRAREAVLKTDLHVLRESIDQYFADKAHYPASLETLVEEGYVRGIPVDPFTESSSTWRLIPPEDKGDALPEEEEAGTAGVFDVKSGSDKTALDGTFYAEW
jgi:general secretion pathway protein G